MLGIVIGVGSVIAMIGIGEGSRQASPGHRAEHGQQHPDHLQRGQREQPHGAPGPGQRGGAQGRGRRADRAGAWRIQSIVAATPQVRTSAAVVFQDSNYQTSIQGVGARFASIQDWGDRGRPHLHGPGYPGPGQGVPPGDDGGREPVPGPAQPRGRDHPHRPAALRGDRRPGLQGRRDDGRPGRCGDGSLHDGAAQAHGSGPHPEHPGQRAGRAGRTRRSRTSPRSCASACAWPRRTRAPSPSASRTTS